MTRGKEERQRLEERLEMIERRVSSPRWSGRPIWKRALAWSLALAAAAGLFAATVATADPTSGVLPCPGGELFCFSPRTPAKANRVNHNFALLKQTLDTVTAPGMILPYAGSSAPTGYLLCDGQAVSRTTYASLFAVIGTTYGVGNGSTTFNLPNLRGRVPVGLGTSAPFATRGNSGGTIEEALTVTQLASHSHGDGSLATVSGGGHAHTLTPYSASGVGGTSCSSSCNDRVMYNSDGLEMSNGARTTSSNGSHSHDVSGATATAGGGAVHNNLQPYLVLNYIIRV